MATTLASFLYSKKTTSEKKKDQITHTRIGDSDYSKGFKGGSYVIETEEDEERLYNLIYQEIVSSKSKKEYLTEKQLKDGVVYLDWDFRYNPEINSRQHDMDWILELVEIYLQHINKIMVIDRNVEIPVYILEKDNVIRLDDKTKDGVHIIIGLNMPNKLQLKLREMVMEDETTKILFQRLPLINSIDKVLDDGLPKGTTNAQVYGCQKPENIPYKLKRIFNTSNDGNSSWNFENERSIKMTRELFGELSVRNKNRLTFEINEQYKQFLNETKATKKGEYSDVNFENKDDLELLVMECISGRRCASGSYSEAFGVRQALKNVAGEDAKDLYRKYVEKAYKDGLGSFNKQNDYEAEWDSVTRSNEEGSLTIRSLHYWAKKDNPERYSTIFKRHSKCIDETTDNTLIETAMTRATDYQLGECFVEMFGEKFKFVRDRLFYHFNDNALWKQDEGGSPIRLMLSNELKKKFIKKENELQAEANGLDPKDPEHELIQRKIKKCGEVVVKLEKTGEKNNILKEISDIIKDADFEKTMNKEQYVLPTKNKKMFNMITLKEIERTILNKFDYECDVNYRELSSKEETDMEKYFSDLFCGKKDTMQVVLNILKSSLCGTPLRFIYFLTGSGRNGKSVLFNILKAIFKNSMDVVSKDVFLEKKSNSHLNTEVEKLDKVRIAYISEVKEEDRMNSEIIKGICGGDGVDLRAIQKTNATLNPTCNLFCLTNELPQFKVEPAICDRLVVIPFLNRFEVDKDFEKSMIERKEAVFCYIMKHGIIADKFDLTDEMKVAKSNYIQKNSKDYLADFIRERVQLTDTSFGKYTECKNNGSVFIPREEFRKIYDDYGKDNDYEVDESNAQQFSKNVAKFNIKSDKSGGATYYLNVKWKQIK